MISPELSRWLDSLPALPDQKSVIHDFIGMRDELVDLVPSTDGRVRFHESAIADHASEHVQQLYARFLVLLNRIVSANLKLCLHAMRRRRLQGDDAFQELALVLRQSVINLNPDKGQLSTLFHFKARRVQRERHEPPPLDPDQPLLEFPDFSERDLATLLHRHLPDLLANLAVRHFIENQSPKLIAEEIGACRAEVVAQLEEIAKRMREVPEVLEHLRSHR